MPGACRSKIGTISTTASSSPAPACDRRGPGIGSARSKRSRMLRLAEIRSVEELLEADDLRAAGRGLAHEPLGPGDVGACIGAAWSWMMPTVNGEESATFKLCVIRSSVRGPRLRIRGWRLAVGSSRFGDSVVGASAGRV